MADPQANMRDQRDNLNASNLNSQHVLANQSFTNPTHVQNLHHADNMVINIQISYNPNASTEPEL